MQIDQEVRFQELMQTAQRYQSLYFVSLAAAAYAVFRQDPQRWQEQYDVFTDTLSASRQTNVTKRYAGTLQKRVPRAGTTWV